MGSAWRGWPPKRSDLRVQGIQDAQLGDDGSRMAVIDPSYQDAGTRWDGKGRIVSPRVASGGRSILYVGLAMSHTVGDFPATKASTGALAVLAHAGGQQHRGHGGSAIGIDGWMAWCTRRRQRSEGRLCHNCHASGYQTLGDLIAPAIACRRSGIKWFASSVSLVRYVRIVVCLRTAAWIGLFDTQDLTG